MSTTAQTLGRINHERGSLFQCGRNTGSTNLIQPTIHFANQASLGKSLGDLEQRFWMLLYASRRA